jgi:hypothetical protein
MHETYLIEAYHTYSNETIFFLDKDTSQPNDYVTVTTTHVPLCKYSSLARFSYCFSLIDV